MESIGGLLISALLVSANLVVASSWQIEDQCDPKNCTQQQRIQGDQIFLCETSNRACDTRNILSSWWSQEAACRRPPQLVILNLLQSSTHGLTLRLAWNATLCGTVNNTRGFKLQLRKVGKPPPGQPQLSVCRIFDLQHNSYNVSFLSSFHFSCLRGIDAATIYDLSITTLPANITVKYVLSLPNDVLALQKAREWTGVLGIAAVIDAGHLLVVFQKAPSNRNITKYQLKLFSNITDVNHPLLTRHLDLTTNWYTFTEVKREETYYVTLQALCTPQCQSKVFTSRNVYLPLASARIRSSSSSPARPSLKSRPTVTLRPTQPAKVTTTGASVIVKPSQEQRQYQENVKIIVGTVGGVCGVVILAILLYCLYRKYRHRISGGFSMQRFGLGRDSDSSITFDDVFKQTPSLLLLYSDDCKVHQDVISAFATYLKMVCGIETYVDMWCETEIQEKGILPWTQEKIEKVQFILIVCSTGARYKCSRNRQFRIKTERAIPDVFSTTVDQVAEQMRQARNNGEQQNKFMVAYFDYAGESDIPPKLELAPRFCLMRDVLNFYCHTYGLKPTVGQYESIFQSVMPEHYHKTKNGKQLQEALVTAKTYFKENPDWLGQKLEPVSPPVTNNTSQTQKQNENSSLNTEGPEEGPQQETISETSTEKSVSPSPESKFLLERNRKRERQNDGKSDTLPSVNGKSPIGTSVQSPSEKPQYVITPPPGNDTKSRTPPRRGEKQNGGAPVEKKKEVEEEEEEIEDEDQLQRDIDFIQNYDVWQRRQSQLLKQDPFNVYAAENTNISPPVWSQSSLSPTQPFPPDQHFGPASSIIQLKEIQTDSDFGPTNNLVSFTSNPFADTVISPSKDINHLQPFQQQEVKL